MALVLLGGVTMAQTLEQGNIITAADFTAATESKKIAIKNGNSAWLSEMTKYDMQCLASSSTLTSNEVFLWEPTGEGTFYLKKLCAAPEEGYVYLTDNATTQGNGAKTLGIGSKENALKFTAIHPSPSGADQYNYTATDNADLIRFYNSDNSNWINCEQSVETASFRNSPGKGAYTAHCVYDMSAYYLVAINFVKDGETTAEYKLYKEGETITLDVPTYEGYEYNIEGSTTKDNTDTQEITVTYTAEVVEPTPDPEEPIEYALYHPSGTNMTAVELMEVTEPTYIAIKGLASANNYYWNYVSGNTYTSTQYFKQDAVFVWEPVTEGEPGSYYLKKVGNGYMQASNPGTYVETTDGAGVFTAVKPVQVDSNANGSGQFNKDTNSTGYITSAGGEDYIVRLVTGENWFCTGDHKYSTQNPSIDKRYGTFTIVQICKLQGFNETVDVQIKEAGNDDYATFYYNAPIQMPENVTAYTVAEITSNSAKLTEVAAGATIPANTGVILKTAVDGDSEIAITVAGDDVEPFTTNLLKGTIEATVATEDIYVLANHTSGVGLYKADRENGDFTIKANGAYLLATDIPEANNSVGFRFDFATTAVEKVEMRNEKEEIYDLQGRSINEITQPGIYVVGGVKVLVK